MSQTMKKLMNGYFQAQEASLLKESRSMEIGSAPGELPISPKKNKSWNILRNPNRFARIWKINNFEIYTAVVQDILEYQDSVHHHGKIILDYPRLKCEIYTHDLNDITELDIEWTKNIDDIISGYSANV